MLPRHASYNPKNSIAAVVLTDVVPSTRPFQPMGLTTLAVARSNPSLDVVQTISIPPLDLMTKDVPVRVQRMVVVQTRRLRHVDPILKAAAAISVLLDVVRMARA